MNYTSSIYKFFFCVVAIFGLNTLGFSQKILQTKSGQKVLIAADGSWSVVKKTETLDDNGNIVQATGTSLDAFEAPSQGKYPLTVDEKAKVENQLLILRSDEAQLLVNYEFFKESLKSLKAKKSLAKSDKDKALENELNNNIELTNTALKQAKKNYETSSTLVLDAEKLIAGKIKNKAKAIAVINEVDLPRNVDSGMGGPIENVKASPSEKNEADRLNKTILLTDKNVADYPTSFDLVEESLPRNKYACEIVFDGYDENIGAKKKQVRSDFFFGYSQDKMKSYFKQDDFITCHAYVTKIGKITFLNLDLRVKSKDAKKTYGILRANETIRLEMVDGSKVYCNNVIQDNGRIEPYTGNTLYTGVYRIEKDDLGTLKKGYLDNIGIIWSTGFEEYNIFEVDFLKNQLSCLEK